MLGHIEDGEPDEEWLLHLAYRCIQFDADEIIGIHGCPSDHIIPMFLNDCLSFIPCVSELHFHPFQLYLHEFAIGRVCQQLVQVLLHGGFGIGSFLTQHVHIFEDERCLLESNDVVYVSDPISLLNTQLQQRVTYEILTTRHKITDELRCIHLFHFLHNIIHLSVPLDPIRVHARLLYREEWQVIELVVQLHWCFDIALDEEPILVQCLE